MKSTALLVNPSRAPLIERGALVDALRARYVAREEYETQFGDIFDQITTYATRNPINVVNPSVFDVLKPRGTS